MSLKPVFLWSVPRSASTAFEKIFLQRGDTQVFHEPYSSCYYYGPERGSNRFGDKPVQPQQTYDAVTDEILAAPPAGKDYVFVKDMPHLAAPALTDTFLGQIKNTFLIRDPVAALASQHKIWPDFTLEETGYPALKQLFDRVSDLQGRAPLLIDAHDFTHAPAPVIDHYCREVSMPFTEDDLHWQPGAVEEWAIWEEWHLEAMQSNSIKPLGPPPDISGQPYVQKMVDKVMPLYEGLSQYKFVPKTPAARGKAPG